ncbi:TetR/AcrR family transcriptional regulator [Mumia zhuanghuii]|uniref:TetR/AcrR family transcriptional regulator n=2 Tax=Mumia TaxID=1546255 RepID=A0ABW1QIN0_9ACTN|nr:MULTISPECIES: TetR/AcrR family transcriptional regulator [Mumia]KAA1423003.1 TetR/AcrR family transcriptional regulator [Mumia zhuanghuii]
MPKISRRDDVRATAARVFREYGYSSATMDLIADTVGLNKGTLYHYYPSKSAILFELLSDQIDETIALADKVPSDAQPSERLRELVRLQVERVAGVSDEVAVFFHEIPWIEKNLPAEQVKDLRQRIDTYRRITEGLLTDGSAAGELRGMDVAMIQYSIIGVLAYVPEWFRHRSPEATAEVVDGLSTFVMSGVLRSGFGSA